MDDKVTLYKADDVIRLLEDLRTRSKYRKATDDYKSELQKTYEDWYGELAEDLGEEEDEAERRRLTEAALVLLLLELKALGRRRLEEAYMMSITDVTPEMADELELLIASNDDYLTDSLIPALGERIEKNVTPDIWFAGVPAIVGTFTGFTHRVGLYAGAYWNAIWRGAAQEQVVQGRENWQVQIRLSPPELGTLRLDVSVRQGVLNMQVLAETAEAKHLIDSRLGQLREALQQNGIIVDRVEVETRRPAPNDSSQHNGDQGSRQGTGQSGQGHGQAGGDRGDGQERGHGFAAVWEQQRYGLEAAEDRPEDPSPDAVADAARAAVDVTV